MMTRKAKWSRFAECFCRRPGIVLLLLPCLVIVTLFFVSEENIVYTNFQYPSYRFYNDTNGTMDGFLVWNSKCHMLSIDALDPSIVKFVKREKFEECFKGNLYTRISKGENDTITLLLDSKFMAAHKNMFCCWSPVIRPNFDNPRKHKFDSTITVKQCESLKTQATIPDDVEVVLVNCQIKSKKKKKQTIYENVHAILNPRKVYDRLENSTNNNVTYGLPRKLSILVLGIDSVSRLNFQRSMPKTEKYLRETGWIGLKGYNKMGDNTFPNLMAILTGQNQEQAYSRCKPSEAYKLDRCPFLWYNFRNAGYITAYGEDETVLNTFNYLKVGFVQPPTDYYLRPYMLASEKLLKSKNRFNLKYCTGPETSFDRIFNYAMDFAQTFVNVPYFGFFWTNSISHENVNGPSLMDSQMFRKLQILKEEGVLNDTMIVFLSDHGMRWGNIRETFVGWYEERLPFIYIWLPDWFRNENPDAYQALKLNENRLTSPFDLYETFRDILLTAGGDADVSPGCPSCNSLFEPIPRERSCQDASIAPHWCACTAFRTASTNDKIVIGGVNSFLNHIENIVKDYKDKKGKRLCAKLQLKKIYRADQMLHFNDKNSTSIEYFCMIQVTPGNGKFEFTVRYNSNASYTVSDHNVSRINPYATSAKCLNHGMKQYCYCVK
ncbi:uncharacterized protein LOC118441589 [Vespa mandarinia]|uniref:uncharacterized protein LOC118441589 n=1 Tax=Vespa mandarinia TaxID=7446 RepID=UPI00160A25B9|nr:uncharacterized protein LOC118441589 [Vespa mandarinia]XP_035722086.1 uncharacterized protein LOC118441589 [Vespa mandarinia]XP_035722087.1 uncharacterized protein LOC118441589 [Vespa mandarinia]XP_035722088.1 uncharacterized protein LOC118441589 [Vespa mandarinia]XP_035722089.1 uncharacterized protein LOC118441589 [Vespa mandarinia]XP_035722090.1 uncharacterized protein LOC118441589 [Vespa mandarinia]